MAAGGILCRLLVLTSLACGTTNTVTLEVTTPSFAAVDGLLFCLAAPHAALSNATFALTAASEGGDQFTPPDRAIAPGEDAFFQAAASYWDHNPIEFGSLRHVLGTDGHYAGSYHVRRYDDLEAAHAGETRDLITRAEGAMAGEGARNCALVTGGWKADTKYALTFDVANPGGGDASSCSGDFVVWFAPVSYAKVPREGDLQEHITYAVRGDKRGQMCAPRAALEAHGTALYDACDAATAALGDGAAFPDPAACLAQVQAHYDGAAVGTPNSPAALATVVSDPHSRPPTPLPPSHSHHSRPQRFHLSPDPRRRAMVEEKGGKT